MKKSFYLSLALIPFIVIPFMQTKPASAGVTVYDDITVSGKHVRLKAITKGRFFAEGGRLVDFYLDEKHAGTALSGGDGYAFLKYYAGLPGIKKIKAVSGADAGEGLLLVTKKTNRAVLIEIEGALMGDFLTPEPSEGSVEALHDLSGRFAIVYLTTALGPERTRAWLKNNGYPASAVIKWEGASAIDELIGREIRLYAIVGSAGIVAEALKIGKRFSFDETEDGTLIKNWSEILKNLK